MCYIAAYRDSEGSFYFGAAVSLDVPGGAGRAAAHSHFHSFYGAAEALFLDPSSLRYNPHHDNAPAGCLPRTVPLPKESLIHSD